MNPHDSDWPDIKDRFIEFDCFENDVYWFWVTYTPALLRVQIRFRFPIEPVSFLHTFISSGEDWNKAGTHEVAIRKYLKLLEEQRKMEIDTDGF